MIYRGLNVPNSSFPLSLISHIYIDCCLFGAFLLSLYLITLLPQGFYSLAILYITIVHHRIPSRIRFLYQYCSVWSPDHPYYCLSPSFLHYSCTVHSISSRAPIQFNSRVFLPFEWINYSKNFFEWIFVFTWGAWMNGEWIWIYSNLFMNIDFLSMQNRGYFIIRYYISFQYYNAGIINSKAKSLETIRFITAWNRQNWNVIDRHIRFYQGSS